VLFGVIAQRTGLGQLFIDNASILAGRYTGGPAKVSVVSSAFFGTISGSSVANTVSTGALTIPNMKRLGYPGHFAGGVEAAASAGGQITPPIMGAAAFIMTEFLELPYTTIVIAAIFPALLHYVGVINTTGIGFRIGFVVTQVAGKLATDLYALLCFGEYHLSVADTGLTINNSIMDVDAHVIASSMNGGLRVAGIAEFANADALPYPRRRRSGVWRAPECGCIVLCNRSVQLSVKGRSPSRHPFQPLAIGTRSPPLHAAPWTARNRDARPHLRPARICKLRRYRLHISHQSPRHFQAEHP
ncbi:TRAP transporter large permease subunit, partial [Epibacterium ulvae]|uniref:TRAP transporter large permease subunit n=1 Tax=Epibacterium ulvae TaxID=1156985 RepID=UPI0033414DDA